MNYQLFIKTTDGVPCCKIQFRYEFHNHTFYNISITNYSLDVIYRVDPDQCPPRDILHLEADNIFNIPYRDNPASDIDISVADPEHLSCIQCFRDLGLYWNYQIITNHGEYILISYAESGC